MKLEQGLLQWEGTVLGTEEQEELGVAWGGGEHSWEVSCPGSLRLVWSARGGSGGLEGWG